MNNNFEEYPHLNQVAEFNPRAIFTYMLLERRRDEESRVFLTRDYIVKDLSLSWTRFLNDVKSLARMGILEWHLAHNNLQIILAESFTDTEELEC